MLEAAAHILQLLAHCQWIGLVHAGEVGTRVFSTSKFDVAIATALPSIVTMICDWTIPILEDGIAAGAEATALSVGLCVAHWASERWKLFGPWWI